MSVERLHEATDLLMARLGAMTAELGRPVTCRAGCFHCCFEPMYAERGEAQALLAAIPEDKREAVEQRTRDWLDRFEKAGLHEHGSSPNGFGSLLKYRAARLPCPLLEAGQCIAYGHRPFGCRTHTAVGSPLRCADDAKRPKQVFLQTTPEAMATLLYAMADESAVLLEFDHLGVWLAELQGLAVQRTKARHGYFLEQDGGAVPQST